jgi:hypothetical protein
MMLVSLFWIMSANCGLRIYHWLEKKRIFSREIIFDTAIFWKSFPLVLTFLRKRASKSISDVRWSAVFFLLHLRYFFALRYFLFLRSLFFTALPFVLTCCGNDPCKSKSNVLGSTDLLLRKMNPKKCVFMCTVHFIKKIRDCIFFYKCFVTCIPMFCFVYEVHWVLSVC